MSIYIVFCALFTGDAFLLPIDDLGRERNTYAAGFGFRGVEYNFKAIFIFSKEADMSSDLFYGEGGFYIRPIICLEVKYSWDRDAGA